MVQAIEHGEGQRCSGMELCSSVHGRHALARNGARERQGRARASAGEAQGKLGRLPIYTSTQGHVRAWRPCGQNNEHLAGAIQPDFGSKFWHIPLRFVSWNHPNYKSTSTKTITEVIKFSHLSPYNSGSPMKS
jgi:hypothetical protein